MMDPIRLSICPWFSPLGSGLRVEGVPSVWTTFIWLSLTKILKWCTLHIDLFRFMVPRLNSLLNVERYTFLEASEHTFSSHSVVYISYILGILKPDSRYLLFDGNNVIQLRETCERDLEFPALHQLVSFFSCACLFYHFLQPRPYPFFQGYTRLFFSLYLLFLRQISGKHLLSCHELSSGIPWAISFVQWNPCI